MDRLEGELRKLHVRRPPPAGFTSRVIERVREEARIQDAGGRHAPAQHSGPGFWRWAAIGAIAASLMGGVYVQQHRARQTRIVAEQAQTDILFSLQFAGVKINQARNFITRPGSGE
jgi:hypothetical protein